MQNRPGRKKGSIPWNKGKKTGYAPWLGKKRSLETIQKIKETKLLNPFFHSSETKKQISLKMTGRKLSKKTKQRIAEAMHKLGRPDHLKGPNNPRWNGKNRHSIRKIILKRDDFRCKKCGGKAIEVDHIIPTKIAPERFSDFSNLQSLCRPCHKQKTVKDRENIKYHTLKLRLAS